MTMSCRICSHEKRLDIEKEIIRGIPHTRIASKYGVGEMSVRGHAQNHLSRELVKRKEIADILHSDHLVNEIHGLTDRTKSILERAERDDKPFLSLSAIRELRSTYELLCKLAVYMTNIIREDSQKERRVEVDKLKENLSDEELNLLSKLLRKAEGEDVEIHTEVNPLRRRRFRRGNKEVKFFEDEEEADGEDDEVGEGTGAEEEKEENKEATGKEKTKMVQSVKGKKKTPFHDETSIGRTSSGLSVFDL